MDVLEIVQCKEMRLQGRLFAEKERSSFLHFSFQPETGYNAQQLCIRPEFHDFLGVFDLQMYDFRHLQTECKEAIQLLVNRQHV